MRHALVLTLILAAAPALAGDLTYRNGVSGAELRLMDTACVNPAAKALIDDKWHPEFKAARARLGNGKVFAGCWKDHEGTAVMFFENGEQVGMPMSAFRDPSV